MNCLLKHLYDNSSRWGGGRRLRALVPIRGAIAAGRPAPLARLGDGERATQRGHRRRAAEALRHAARDVDPLLKRVRRLRVLALGAERAPARAQRGREPRQEPLTVGERGRLLARERRTRGGARRGGARRGGARRGGARGASCASAGARARPRARRSRFGARSGRRSQRSSSSTARSSSSHGASSSPATSSSASPEAPRTSTAAGGGGRRAAARARVGGPARASARASAARARAAGSRASFGRDAQLLALVRCAGHALTRTREQYRAPTQRAAQPARPAPARAEAPRAAVDARGGGGGGGGGVAAVSAAAAAATASRPAARRGCRRTARVLGVERGREHRRHPQARRRRARHGRLRGLESTTTPRPRRRRRPRRHGRARRTRAAARRRGPRLPRARDPPEAARARAAAASSPRRVRRCPAPLRPCGGGPLGMQARLAA